MIFLITIIFIAQLVLCANIVICLVAADNKVCALSEYAVDFNYKLKERLSAIRYKTNELNKAIADSDKNLIKARNNILANSLNKAVQSFILLFFKSKYKRILIGVKVISGIIKDLFKKS